MDNYFFMGKPMEQEWNTDKKAINKDKNFWPGVTYLLYTLLFSSGLNLPRFEGKGFLSLPLPSSGIICLPVTAWVSTTGDGQLPAVYKVEKSSPHGMARWSYSTTMGKSCTQNVVGKTKHMTKIKKHNQNATAKQMSTLLIHIIYLSKNKRLRHNILLLT